LDVVCALVIPTPGSPQIEAIGLFISLGRQHGTLPHLAGGYPLNPGSHRTPYVWLGDFNGDGLDDIVIAEEPAPDAGITSTIEIYPMGP
jgi:hypothetical protein